MSWLVQARLINDPFSDPGVFVDFRFGSRALLFDLGDLAPLSARELLRVSHALVSHAHLDHFCGFDRLLRLRLHRELPLHLVGPPGMGDRVAAKFEAYTWNLLDQSSPDFVVTVDEFDGRLGRRSRFAARTAFARADAEPPALPDGVVLDDDQFQVEAAVLDHGIPCLGFALQERLRVNVWRDGLARLGLPVGPWLNEAKAAVRRGDPDDATITVDGSRTVRLGDLRREALRVAAGQRLAYVVDIEGHAANIEKAVQLCRGADPLFIEAAFANEDAALATARRHLTSGQAAHVARLAAARRVIPLHFSPRYLDRPDLIPGQVQANARAGCTAQSVDR
jgi:ribonuclease Z